MLRSVTNLKHYAIAATDGIIGDVKDIYFDDTSWTVRYFVVETGAWFARRKILISPTSIETADWQAKLLRGSISTLEARNRPAIDIDKPVSRQHEMRYAGYYRYPHYSGCEGLSGTGPHPRAMTGGLGYTGTSPQYRQEMDERARRGQVAEFQRHDHDDHHLRSCAAVLNFNVHATDGDMGRIQDFLVDEITWTIRSVIVEAGSRWDAHRVLLDPHQIIGQRWGAGRLSIQHTRQFLESAPTYTAETDVHVRVKSPL